MAAQRKTRGVDRGRAKTANRRVQALELRTKGYSLRAIARELGLGGPESARKLVDGALKDIVSPKVADLRKEIDERSRLLLEQLVPIALSTRRPLDERLDAMDRVVRIDRELRALHGVDAPVTTLAMTTEAPKDVRQQLLDRLASLAEAAAARAADSEPVG